MFGVARAHWLPNTNAVSQDKIIAGQNKVIAEVSNVFSGSTDVFHVLGGDGVHFNDLVLIISL